MLCRAHKHARSARADIAGPLSSLSDSTRASMQCMIMSTKRSARNFPLCSSPSSRTLFITLCWLAAVAFTQMSGLRSTDSTYFSTVSGRYCNSASSVITIMLYTSSSNPTPFVI